MINRMICQTAPEERPETCIRLLCGLRLLSPPDYPLAAGDGLLPVRLPAGRQHPVHPVNPV